MKPFDPRVLRELPATRRPVALLGGLGALQGVAALAGTIAIGNLVVAVVRGSSLLAPALAVAAVLTVRGLLAAAAEKAQAWAGGRISAQMRERLISSWLRAGTGERQHTASDLTLAAQGASSIEPYIARYLPSLISAAVVPPLAVLLLLIVDWPSAVVVILTLPLLPMFAVLIGKATADETDKRWTALTALSGHFLDVMRGLPTLVNFGRARTQTATIAEVSQRHRLATMRTLKMAFMSSAALELLATISVAIVAVLVGLRLTHGRMDLLPGLIAILIAPEAYWPVRRVGQEFHAAADGSAAIEAILERTGRARSGAHNGSGEPGQADAHGVSYTYPGTEHAVLTDVSLRAAGLTAIVGPSGCGKTTLAEILAGLRLPTSGRVEVGSHHLVSQRPFLGAGSVRENLTLGTQATGEEIWQALRTVGLEGVIIALPEGLETRIGDDGYGLSAGQRARLVLARALLSKSSVLILDEPTAHIDPDSRRAVHEVISSLAATRTVIVITHDAALIKCATQVHSLPATHTAAIDTAAAPNRSSSATQPVAPVTFSSPGVSETAPALRTGVLTINAQVIKAGLLGAGAVISGIALTATSGWLIVRASQMPQILLLLTIIVAVRTFGLSRPVFRYFERLASHDAALADLAERRTATYAALIPLTPARLGKRGRSDLLTAVVDDLTDVVEASVRVTVPIISVLLAGALSALIATLIDPTVGLIIAGMLLLASLVAWLGWRLESRSLATVGAARAEVNRVAQLVADASGELHAIGARQQAHDWLAEAHARLQRATSLQSRGRSLVAGAMLLITGGATIGAAFAASSKDHSLPVLGLLVLLPLATGDALGNLADATRALARAQGSSTRLRSIVSLTPAVAQAGDSGASPVRGVDVPESVSRDGLTLDEVAAGWNPERTDLAPTTVRLEPGRHLALTGANGVGKSTLLAVIARHLDPTRGRYSIGGQDALTQPLEQARAHFAIVDDEPHIFASTLRENLKLAAPGCGDEAIVEALTSAGLAGWLGGLSRGLETHLGAHGQSVSGGERARLAIARALLSGRPVMLLDEPLAHLDRPTAQAVMRDVLAASHERTVVMATHNLDIPPEMDTLNLLPPAPTRADQNRPCGMAQAGATAGATGMAPQDGTVNR